MPDYNSSQKQWIERLSLLPDNELTELEASMSQVLDNWKAGNRSDFDLRLALVRDELASRQKKNPGKPGS